jgi:cytochrome c oxidase subunit 2
MCELSRGRGHKRHRSCPDLTHLMSRRTIAAGAAENTGENLRLWIQNPDAIKPGSLMPAMKLSDQDLNALTRYLETLR